MSMWPALSIYCMLEQLCHPLQRVTGVANITTNRPTYCRLALGKRMSKKLHWQYIPT